LSYKISKGNNLQQGGVLVSRDFKDLFKRLGRAFVILTAGAVAVSSTTVGILPMINSTDYINRVYAMPVVTQMVQNKFPFPDVKEEWAKEPILWGIDKKLVSGYPDGTFRPLNPVTESEFVKMMAVFVGISSNSDVVTDGSAHWAQNYYDAVDDYKIPLKGYSNDNLKSVKLTRGDVARIVAAKNGFNLNERQAIYYMYENDLSYGKIAGRLDFESYGANDYLQRDQAVAFLKRLESVGVTTFMGKPSNVKGNEIGGIVNVPPETVEITDEMFDELARKKGITNPTGNNSKYEFANKIADKYGLKVDDGGTGGFDIVGSDKIYVFYKELGNGAFDLKVQDYQNNKQLLIDLLKGTGKLKDSEINQIIKFIEVDHVANCNIPDYYNFGNGSVLIEGAPERSDAYVRITCTFR